VGLRVRREDREAGTETLIASPAPRLIPRLRDSNPQVVTAAGIILSRMGSEAALAPLEGAAKAHREIPRLTTAVEDLRKRPTR
jgi:HEAT repeat protein